MVTPRSRDGLTRLIADLPAAPISEIQKSLSDEELDFSIPTYYVETTLKPVAALAKVSMCGLLKKVKRGSNAI